MAWDENGNLITGLDNSAYIYNWDDKLRSASVGTDTVQVKYDPDGNRIYKSVNGTARKYIIAEIGGLSVILMELDSGLNIQKSYVYDTTAQIQTQYDGSMATGDKYFYIHDRLGSVRQVIDVNGNVVRLYTYGPYGKKLEVDDAPAAPGNPYQYTGLYADEELNQYHARARQHYPAIYRFTSRDPVIGDYKEPLTLHAYLYCLNDAINRTDLAGEMSINEENAVQGIGNSLNTVSGGFDAAMRVKDIAKQVTAGVSMQNIMLSVAIDVASDKVGGKFLDSIVDSAKSLGKLRRSLANSPGHHPVPMWAGGNPVQDLIGKADGLSDNLHKALEKDIKKEMKKLGIQIGGKGGAAEDIAGLMADNPNLQVEAFDKILDIYRTYDTKYGTELVQGFWHNWMTKINSVF